MTRTTAKILTLGATLAAFVSVAHTATAQANSPVLADTRVVAVPSAPVGPGSLGDLFRGAPGTGLGTPLAFGPGMGDVFVGGTYQAKTRNLKIAKHTWGPDGLDDASISLGFGLGDANELVGLSTVVTSMSTFRGGDGALSFQLFHNFGPTLSVAVGVEDAVISGGVTNGSSFYSVASKAFVQPIKGADFLKAITVSGGVGTGRFRFITDQNRDLKRVNLFTSASVLIHDQLSLIGDYTGQDINVGLSVVPFKKFPIAITPALVDLTGVANKSPRFIVGASLGVHF